MAPFRHSGGCDNVNVQAAYGTQYQAAEAVVWKYSWSASKEVQTRHAGKSRLGYDADFVQSPDRGILNVVCRKRMVPERSNVWIRPGPWKSIMLSNSCHICLIIRRRNIISSECLSYNSISLKRFAPNNPVTRCVNQTYYIYSYLPRLKIH